MLADWVDNDSELFEEAIRYVLNQEFTNFDTDDDSLYYDVYISDIGGLYLDEDTLTEFIAENCPALSGMPTDAYICLADSIHAGNCLEQTLAVGKLLGFEVTEFSKPIDLLIAKVKFGKLASLCDKNDDCRDMLLEYVECFKHTIDSANDRIKNGLTYTWKYDFISQWRDETGN